MDKGQANGQLENQNKEHSSQFSNLVRNFSLFCDPGLRTLAAAIGTGQAAAIDTGQARAKALVSLKIKQRNFSQFPNFLTVLNCDPGLRDLAASKNQQKFGLMSFSLSPESILVTQRLGIDPGPVFWRSWPSLGQSIFSKVDHYLTNRLKEKLVFYEFFFSLHQQTASNSLELTAH